MHDRPIMLRLRQPSAAIGPADREPHQRALPAVADRPRKNVMPVSYHVAAAWTRASSSSTSRALPRRLGALRRRRRAPVPQHLARLQHRQGEGAGRGGGQARRAAAGDQLRLGGPRRAGAAVHAAADGPPDPTCRSRWPARRRSSATPSGAAQDMLIAHRRRRPAHPFQLTAIQTLGSLPASRRPQRRCSARCWSRRTRRSASRPTRSLAATATRASTPAGQHPRNGRRRPTRSSRSTSSPATASR